MIDGISSGSEAETRPTKQTPSAKDVRMCDAICMARRLLPIPPMPASVTRRTSGRNSMASIAATSCSRPINEVKVVGTFHSGSGLTTLRNTLGSSTGAGKVTGVEAANEAFCRASAKCYTRVKRCSGSLARACSTTCSMAGVSSGICSRRGLGGIVRCCMATSMSVP